VRRPAWVVAGALVAAVGVGGCAAQAGGWSATASRGDGRPAMLAQAVQNPAAHTSTPFKGVKANTGTVTHTTMPDGKQVLTVSEDFKIPETPAPHWQVVDSGGNVYLLQQMRIKDNRTNRTITLPAYVRDVAKVQLWCSYAEALLGEASFAMPVR